MSIRPTPFDVLHQRRKIRRIPLELHKDRNTKEQYDQNVTVTTKTR
jgi:hypothetical protein